MWRNNGGSQDEYNKWRSHFGDGAPILTLPGDYNASGMVDAGDYVEWRNAFGQAGAGLAADGNGDGLVNQADYDLCCPLRPNDCRLIDDRF